MIGGWFEPEPTALFVADRDEVMKLWESQNRRCCACDKETPVTEMMLIQAEPAELFCQECW